MRLGRSSRLAKLSYVDRYGTARGEKELRHSERAFRREESLYLLPFPLKFVFLNFLECFDWFAPIGAQVVPGWSFLRIALANHFAMMQT